MNHIYKATENPDLPFGVGPAGYAYRCFPVRNIRKFKPDDGGAWLVELKAEKRRQIDALKRKKIKSVESKPQRKVNDFNGFYLIKEFHVDEPTDLCSINISGKDLLVCKQEDFSLFDNMVSIDASDNQLTLDAFRTFPKLEELQLQVNGISCIHIIHKDFMCLRKLDLSYNNLKRKSLLNLGKLQNLEDLCLRSCGLTTLPPQLARGYQVSESEQEERKMKAESKTRFLNLTYLDLSENELTDLSTFASLAGLRKLRCLNLSCNQITCVPHLRLMVTHRYFSSSTCTELSSSHIDQVAYSESLKREVRHNVSKATDIKSPEMCELSVRTQMTNNTQNNNESMGDVHNEKRAFNKDEENTKLISKSAEEDTMDVDTNDKKVVFENKEINLIDEIDETVCNFDENTADETNELLNLNFAQEVNFHSEDDCLQNDESDNVLNDDIKRPFASLETLDLSNNLVVDEESLLALTSWPLLQHLKVWGNPVMKSFKGTPPVLAHHLQKMCGIQIYRKEPNIEPVRPRLAASIASTTKTFHVKADLPPIKKNNLLMIEGAINGAVNKEAQSDNMKRKVEQIKHTCHEEAKEKRKKEEENNIFLTQVVDDTDEILPSENQPNTLKAVEEKYKGYELLLKLDQSDEYDPPLPTTMQGSVQALKNMLDHPLVFNDTPYSNEHIKLFKNKPKKKSRSATLQKSKRVDTLAEVLDDIQLTNTSYKENLDFVLENFDKDPEIRKKFPEVKKMVKNVQEKYDKVRMESLRPIYMAQQDLGGNSTRVEQPSQELILARMKQGRIGDLYSSSRGNTPRTKFRGKLT